MITIKQNFSLLNYNTFHIDIKAKRFVEYESVEDLRNFFSENDFRQCSPSGLAPFLHIGSGSNLLFNGDYPGTVLHSKIKFTKVLERDENYVTVKLGSGIIWDDFVSYAVSQGWYGAENLSLIPGEVGACAIQNIGAYGVEIKDLVKELDVIDLEGNERVYTNADCDYGYRDSVFKRAECKDRIVTSVTLRLGLKENYSLGYGRLKEQISRRFGPMISLSAVRDSVITLRMSKLPDPRLIGNAGSFFMNPVISRVKFADIKNDYEDVPFYKIDEDHVKVPAAWLIETCGWKGKTVGRAGVYENQALILVNRGGAVGSEIIDLAHSIVDSVEKKFGIKLRMEVNII
ncbi:MAG: UDP-N-acetylmuramate dehydrogenase [Bacteroidales bacterium]